MAVASISAVSVDAVSPSCDGRTAVRTDRVTLSTAVRAVLTASTRAVVVVLVRTAARNMVVAAPMTTIPTTIATIVSRMLNPASARGAAALVGAFTAPARS